MSIEGEIDKILIFSKIKKNPNFFLKKIKGIIHVGANEGQEREEYKNNSLDVLWIEPIPEIFNQLRKNIKGYPKQKALKYLLLDEDNKKIPFKIANNKGASSSIFDFGLHSKIWPNVNYTKTIKLKSSKLTTIINDENIDIKKFQALLIDTQGSELIVLKGASEILKNFDYIITEAADFESYIGGCKIEDLSIFLKTFGFNPILKTKFAKHSGAGNYYDIIYKKSK